ncbi:MAG: hypothetical protein NC191_07005 [Muribaculaceae bacterium]|nr:hypothetical protein [Muribaculaceae bacterium]
MDDICTALSKELGFTSTVDFTIPENFVQLLELPINCASDLYETVGEYVYYHDSDFNNRNMFLNNLYYLLTQCDIEHKNCVREAVKNAEWVFKRRAY